MTVFIHADFDSLQDPDVFSENVLYPVNFFLLFLYIEILWLEVFEACLHRRYIMVAVIAEAYSLKACRDCCTGTGFHAGSSTVE